MLDLRGNPAVCSTWPSRLPSGSSTRDWSYRPADGPGTNQICWPTRVARWRMPMYVLVDRDSGSAAKSWPVPLQDHNRATILGARTLRQGLGPEHFSLRSAPAGLKLTTAKFYSPHNRPYSEQGVHPDIPITLRFSAGQTTPAPPQPRVTISAGATPAKTSSSRPRSGQPRSVLATRL